MNSREHECPRCGDTWHCDGCDDGATERLCDVCRAKPADQMPTNSLSNDSLLDRLVESQERYQRDVWTQTREGRYSAWRALLERDIADVAYHLDHADWPEHGALTMAQIDDCQAWLTRARAALA